MTGDQGDTLEGHRYLDALDGLTLMLPGGYRRLRDGWEALTPNGLLANLSAHTVTEHDDGTITVSPSILVKTPGQPDQTWHGYLEKGVWRRV